MPEKIYTAEMLMDAIKDNPNYDQKAIEEALAFAQKAHEGQCRWSGEPYIHHPIAVACILVELGMDTASILAALLHDVVEDTPVTLDEIKQRFGEETAMLVDGVTKVTRLGKLPYSSREEQQAESLRKMLIAMSEDIRVIIIKLADRLHNMRTIDAMPEQKRRDKSLETLEIYAPIAHRLGIRAVKEEMEDLAIRQLDPVAYHDIETSLAERRQDRKEFLDTVQNRIRERLSEHWPDVYIEGRVKSIHGIYRKMFMQGKTLDEIYDIYAIRVIVNTVNDCYNVLGIIHEIFRPIPGRFKDYISTPKPNMYQSLHTTLISREGIPFEVQIRTWDMHYTAEYGIAAHWKYKSGIQNSDEKMEERLAWIRQLLESQNESDDAEEFVRTIKTDLTQDDVFAVTPKGDVITLPIGSTIVDFAYAIHSAVGNRMVGAKVDGRIVPLDYQIKTGEIIEILTTQAAGHGPNRDWLGFVKTSEARSKIRAWFKKERRPENIAEGKNMIDREFRRGMNSVSEEQKQTLLDDVAKLYHCQTLDDFYAMLGYGGLLIQRVVPRMREEYTRLRQQNKPEIDLQKLVAPKATAGSNNQIIVEGIDNCLVRLSHCCDPLPGDQIIGFITRGHGVSIHTRDCPNVPKIVEKSEEPERWVRAHWNDSSGEVFKSTLYVLAIDRPSLLADVTVLLGSLHVAIHAVNARELKGGNCQIILTISTEGKEHLNSIIQRLSKLNGVVSVERTGS